MRDFEMAYGRRNLWQALETISPWTRHCDSTKSYQLVENDKNESILYVNAPGYAQENISVEMQGGQLTILGQLSSKTDISPSKLDYKFNVSTDYRVEDATIEHGILAVRLVRQHRAEAVKIPIRSSS